ncbi:MAG: SRPBCC family protein [Planctomycetes bacterium]|nr:SRPBCC family protein [Planctomycetota bacterium]
MTQMQMTTHVKADPVKTFDAFADFPRAAEMVRGIKRVELLTNGPVGKGTRFKETRIMFGKEATETMEVSAFERGKLYTLSCTSCGVAWSSTFRFTPDAGGTRVDLEMVCKPLTFFAKLMSPLGKLMAGSMKKCIEGDINDVRTFVETGTCAV